MGPWLDILYESSFSAFANGNTDSLFGTDLFLPFSVNPVCPIFFLSIKIEKSDLYSSIAKNMNISDDGNERPGPACKLFVCSNSFFVHR